MREPTRTADAREAVRRRVRRVTGVVVAASLAVAGSIAAYVAGASTQKSVGGTTTTRTTTATTKVPVPASPTPPSLDSNDSSSPPPLQTVPAQAPTPSPSPPVAVSGGS